MAAELLDAAKQLVDVAGVLAQQPALGDLRIDLIRSVPYLAEADQSLVGMVLNQAAVKRSTDDVGEADVGNAELRRARMRIYVGKRVFFIGLLVRHFNQSSYAGFRRSDSGKRRTAGYGFVLFHDGYGRKPSPLNLSEPDGKRRCRIVMISFVFLRGIPGFLFT
jgi:hypothetical protein